jgi:putative restriction endonuclease
VAELADFLDLTVGQAREQFRELRRRSPVSTGRQVTFLPVETLLCLAASFLVNHRRFGGSTAHLASVLAKMANLDGSRSHGGKWDILAGAMLREDGAQFTHIYRVLLHAARAEGVDRTSLPDFLDLEDGGEFALLGQDELGTSVFENALKDQIVRSAAQNDWPEQDTERIILAAARVGQHVFALNVLNNCGRRCVFCGLNPSAYGAKRMLLAGHIKPWKDSSPTRASGSAERSGRLPQPRCGLRYGTAHRQRGVEDPHRPVAG